MKTSARKTEHTRLVNRPRRCVECSALFATGESYRDHLPCSGTMSPELIEWRKTHENPVVQL